MNEARLLVAMHWSWAELQETPAEVVDAVIGELNRRAGAPEAAGDPRVEM